MDVMSSADRAAAGPCRSSEPGSNIGCRGRIGRSGMMAQSPGWVDTARCGARETCNGFETESWPRHERSIRNMISSEWNQLPTSLQLVLSHEALKHAVRIIACQAEVLATEMEAGSLDDRGGPEALRLLAAIARIMSDDRLPSACVDGSH